MNYPEMVVTNARYRGPMESRKQNNASLDIYRTLTLVRQSFEKLKSDTTTLYGDVLTEYNETIPSTRRVVVNGVLAVKGGEM